MMITLPTLAPTVSRTAVVDGTARSAGPQSTDIILYLFFRPKASPSPLLSHHSRGLRLAQAENLPFKHIKSP